MATRDRDEVSQAGTSSSRKTPRKRRVPDTRRSFARSVPRAAKRRAGKTSVVDTPIRIHVAGTQLEEADKLELRTKLGRSLQRFAPQITRGVVRFKDINGPRGGVDTLCRIKLSVTGMDDLVVEARATEPRFAFASASRMSKTALTRAMDRQGRAMGRIDRGPSKRPSRTPPRARPEGGSLIGRRVGRSRENLLRAAERPEKISRDVWTDTSLPGVSETDRKAGGGSTAARNTSLRARKATVTLEDSAQARPSRKSTRKSANRQKSSGKVERVMRRKKHAPSARARRSAATR